MVPDSYWELVKSYEYEIGFYEYTDSEGNQRIGKWEQKYEVYKGYYGGKKVRGKKVGVVDFNPDEDTDEYVGGVPDKRRECPNCLNNYDVHSKLGPRTFKNDEPIPEDNDLFLQCYVCWSVFPVHEIERQKKLEVNELKGHIVENPFEANQTLIESIPKRSSPAGKNAARGRKRKKTILHEDPEINELMRIYGDRVNVVYDTNP